MKPIFFNASEFAPWISLLGAVAAELISNANPGNFNVRIITTRFVWVGGFGNPK